MYCLYKIVITPQFYPFCGIEICRLQLIRMTTDINFVFLFYQII